MGEADPSPCVLQTEVNRLLEHVIYFYFVVLICADMDQIMLNDRQKCALEVKGLWEEFRVAGKRLG